VTPAHTCRVHRALRLGAGVDTDFGGFTAFHVSFLKVLKLDADEELPLLPPWDKQDHIDHEEVLYSLQRAGASVNLPLGGWCGVVSCCPQTNVLTSS
jgi:hypothetical protein